MIEEFAFHRVLPELPSTGKLGKQKKDERNQCLRLHGLPAPTGGGGLGKPTPARMGVGRKSSLWNIGNIGAAAVRHFGAKPYLAISAGAPR